MIKVTFSLQLQRNITVESFIIANIHSKSIKEEEEKRKEWMPFDTEQVKKTNPKPEINIVCEGNRQNILAYKSGLQSI